jgi:acyl-CoA reductase-like NAD-dependent aldehyde dehydrogenase
VTTPAAARTSERQSRAVTPGREPGTKTSRSPVLARLTREARERLGPDATERQVAEAAESARKAFYARLSAAGVAARRAALHEALMRQRRSALAFEIVEANRDRRARAG